MSLPIALSPVKKGRSVMYLKVGRESMEINIEKLINKCLQSSLDYISSVTAILQRAAIDLKGLQRCRFIKHTLNLQISKKKAEWAFFSCFTFREKLGCSGDRKRNNL